jgi:predicted RNA methylase
MMNLDLIEKKRTDLQNKLDSKKSQLERNILGQFATPHNLAQDIVTYIFKRKLIKNEQIRFLDPAIGTGAFYSALINKTQKQKLISATGIEIDNEFASIASELWENYGLNIINSDFTKIDPPKDNNELANLIITNPPYIRHHHIDYNDKKRLQQLIKDKFGYKINGLSGLYCYFILLSHSWLRNNGYGIWLIPSEFMDVNYGITIKKYLTEKVTLIHSHRFDINDVQFADALVSSAIIIFKKRTPKKNDKAIFSYGGNLLHPIFEQEISINKLKHLRKWTHLPKETVLHKLDEKDDGVKLGDYFKIHRGIATGANNFFIMSRKKASSIGIPEKFLKPVLPSPRYLKVDIIEPDNSGFPILNEQLVVIDSNIPEENLKTDYKSFYDYLKTGKEKGITDRYLPKKRNPWYKQEYRDPPPFLCTYMGRNNDKYKPFRFIWNKTNAISTNVYLLLYPKDFLLGILNENPELYQVVFKALKEVRLEEMIRNGRVYGGGLHKIEPKELAGLSANKFVKVLEEYQHLNEITLPLRAGEFPL